VDKLSKLDAATASRSDVTSALEAIESDLQRIRDARADLAPERRQQVQEATAAFEAQLKDILRDAIAGLVTTDVKTLATEAADSLRSAVRESLAPIDC
jgi:hypothetical protein